MTKRTVKVCPECRAEHSRARAIFCSTAHQKAWNGRSLKEGAALASLVKAWAMGRGGGHTPTHEIAKAAMREITQIAKDYNDADRAAGRMPALEYAGILMANGSRHFDRRRA